MADDITPALTDVGAILRARTRNDEGVELGTFTADTRPTGTEVDAFIAQATAEVRLRLPADIPADLEPFVKRLIAIRSAMFAELSFDPDRTDETSAYDRLGEMFESGMQALLGSLDDRGEDVDAGGRMVSATVVSPYSGPADSLLDLLS